MNGVAERRFEDLASVDGARGGLPEPPPVAHRLGRRSLGTEAVAGLRQHAGGICVFISMNHQAVFAGGTRS